MPSWISAVMQWAQHNVALVWSATAVSGIVFLAFVIGVPILMVKLPADYFQRPHASWRGRNGWSVWRLVYLSFKNAIGVMLVLAGIAMLFLPGQGLLSMIIGVSMINAPGKRRLVRWILGEQRVLKPINRLRARFGKPPFQIEHEKKSRRNPPRGR